MNDIVDGQFKKAIIRSPNYPFINLKEAINYARSLHEHANMHPLSEEAAHKIWGFKVNGSNSKRIAAALKEYGLIEYSGKTDKRYYQVTNAGRRLILDPKNDLDLLGKTALAPKLYRDIWQHYNGSLPPNNEIIKQHLILEKSFNKLFVDDFISNFLETITFAQLGKPAILLNNIVKADIHLKEHDDFIDNNIVLTGVEVQPPPTPETPYVKKNPPLIDESTHEFKFPLTSGEAVLRVPKPMSSKDFDMLVGYINLWRSAL